MKDFMFEFKKHKAGIASFAGVAVIFFFIFYLYGLEMKFVLYPAILSLIYLACVYLVCYFKTKKCHQKLDLIKEQPAFSIPAMLPQPADILERDYTEIINKVVSELSSIIEADEKKNKDLVDYYATWVHQIKTPIASMKLKLESIDSKDARELRSNLRNIESYVDMVMTYLRLNSEHTDYVIKAEKLKPLVSQTVRKFSTDFIERKLSASINIDENAAVLTDSKWASLVIEQIISNALKYTREGGISISFDKDRYALTIADTGIGIDAANLPRIFEKGYTGFNGRGESHSSGIGLYVSKKIADSLHIQIECSSAVNEGTTMTLVFPQDKSFYE